MSFVSKKSLDFINVEIVSKLLSQERIDDIKKIAVAGGKSNTSVLNTECLRVLEIEMGAEYAAFYNNLKN